MKAVTNPRARFIVLLLVTGTIALVLLMHVTSSDKASCCAREASEIGVIKLI